MPQGGQNYLRILPLRGSILHAYVHPVGNYFFSGFPVWLFPELSQVFLHETRSHLWYSGLLGPPPIGIPKL